MTIKEIGEEVIEEFSIFDDWMDKYNYIIELGRDLELISEDQKTPSISLMDVNPEYGWQQIIPMVY